MALLSADFLTAGTASNAAPPLVSSVSNPTGSLTYSPPVYRPRPDVATTANVFNAPLKPGALVSSTPQAVCSHCTHGGGAAGGASGGAAGGSTGVTPAVSVPPGATTKSARAELAQLTAQLKATSASATGAPDPRAALAFLSPTTLGIGALLVLLLLARSKR